MAPDYLKLFLARRLTVKEPHHLEIINARLANMKFDDPVGYKDYSEYYGIEIEGDVRAKKVTPGKTRKATKSERAKQKKKEEKDAKKAKDDKKKS